MKRELPQRKGAAFYPQKTCSVCLPEYFEVKIFGARCWTHQLHPHMGRDLSPVTQGAEEAFSDCVCLS